jgi:ribosomal protein S18 acetylase RimI-like enzyme
MGQPVIRRASAADVPTLASMLTRSFLDDPVACWAFRPKRLRPRALERFQATRLRQTLPGEEVWTTDDLSCAALWIPAGMHHKSIRQEVSEMIEMLPCFAHPRLLGRVPLVSAGWLNMEQAHPKSPAHWYLAVLGTDPAAQGRGLGSAVLSRALDQCDEDGVGAYLESSNDGSGNL